MIINKLYKRNLFILIGFSVVSMHALCIKWVMSKHNSDIVIQIPKHNTLEVKFSIEKKEYTAPIKIETKPQIKPRIKVQEKAQEQPKKIEYIAEKAIKSSQKLQPQQTIQTTKTTIKDLPPQPKILAVANIANKSNVQNINHIIDKNIQPQILSQSISQTEEKKIDTKVVEKVAVAATTTTIQATPNTQTNLANKDQNISNSNSNTHNSKTGDVSAKYLGEKPPYPDEAKEAHITGTLILKILVAINGRAKKVIILTSSGEDILDMAAKYHFQKARFTPQIKSGEAIEGWYEQKVTFDLKTNRN